MTRFGSTTNFLSRRNDLWMGRNLREHRRMAGIRGGDGSRASNSHYYPGIRVRDIGRGQDFYPQEEALRGSEFNTYNFDEEQRLILNEDSGESDEEAHRENYIHDNYMNVFYGAEANQQNSS